MLVRRAAVAAVSLALALTGCQFSGGVGQVTNDDGVCTEIELPAVDLAAPPTVETQLPGPVLRPCPTSEPTTEPTITEPPTTTEPPPPTTTEPPPAASTVPQNLTGIADQAARTIALDWDDVAGATEYKIYGRWWQGGVLMDGGDHLVTTVPASTRTSGTLAGDATYDYWVTAVVDGVESGPSAEVRVVLGADTSPGDTTEPPSTTEPPTTEPPPSGTVPVGATPVFTGFDDADLGEFSNVQTFDRNGDPAGYCSRAICVRDGGPGHATAAQVTVEDGDVPNFGGGERAELRAPDSVEVEPGDERWYQFSLRFDEAFPNPTGGWFIVMQWHAGSGSPPLALEVSRSGVLQFANNRTGDRTDIGPVQRGVWVDYVLHVRHSTGSDAIAEAWVDGVHTATHTVPNMADGDSYLKVGIYRDGDDSATAEVWHDDLIITAP